jgi:hypothetical protein
LLTFLKGFRENWVFGGGFLMVKTWWDAWWMWSDNTTIFGFEKYANFLKVIFAWPGKVASGTLSGTDSRSRRVQIWEGSPHS